MVSDADTQPWWRRGVVYQVYIRSFADSNGDGLGDVPGIQSRLEYLRDLGVDALWITPWYPSPLNDGGYDVADYRNIDPRFGSLDDARSLIARAHSLGLRVIVDLVPNHTSSDHQWFIDALAAGPDSPERGRYIFRDGKGPNGDEAPNNWPAVFGGPAWERVADGQWYLHLFDTTQPDLEWRNPEVRQEFRSIIEFWLDLGVSGLRVDVAHGMAKDPSLPDLEERPIEAHRTHLLNHPHWDRDEVHDIIREWRSVLDRYEGDRMMVAEAWVHTDRLPLYLRPDEFHQSFNFDLLEANWDAGELRTIARNAVAAASAMGATSTWVLSNHDVMRHASRYGLPNGTNWRSWPATGPHDVLDPTLGLRRARAAALFTLALPGSAYIYQGEELGLPEVWDLPDDVLDDPTWERSGHTERGRDGCRVPIPWQATGPSFGFGSAAPWLPQPPQFGALSVASQAGDPTSMLELYRAALALRRTLLTADESFLELDLGPQVVGFERGSGVRCVMNLSPEPIDLPDGEVLLSSVSLVDGRLPSDAAAWVGPRA